MRSWLKGFLTLRILLLLGLLLFMNSFMLFGSCPVVKTDQSCTTTLFSNQAPSTYLNEMAQALTDLSCPDMPVCDSQYNQCYTCQRPNPDQYLAMDPSMTIEELENIDNSMFADYGAIFQDIVNPPSPICIDLAKAYLCRKISNAFSNTSPGSCPFQGWLEGAYVYLIMGSALTLGGMGKLDTLLGYWIDRVAQCYAPNCSNCNFDSGNTCLDNLMTNAAADAWVSAWEALNGRIFDGNQLVTTHLPRACLHLEAGLELFPDGYDYWGTCARDTNSVDYATCKDFCAINTPIFTDASCHPSYSSNLCSYDDYAWALSAFCSDLTQSEPAVQIQTFNRRGKCCSQNSESTYKHNYQTPVYGVGMMSSASAALSGFLNAGFPYLFNLNNEKDKFHVLVAQELLREGQIHSEGSYPNDLEFANDCAWWEAGEAQCMSGLTGNAPCWDKSSCGDYAICPKGAKGWICPDSINHYRPTMFPVYPAYALFFHIDERNQLCPGTLPPLDGYRFDQFNASYFQPDPPETDPGDIFSFGRLSVYRDLGACWYFPEHPLINYGDLTRPDYCNDTTDRPRLQGLPMIWYDMPLNHFPFSYVNKETTFHGWSYVNTPENIAQETSVQYLLGNSDDPNIACDNIGDFVNTQEDSRKDVCDFYSCKFNYTHYYHDSRCDNAGFGVGWKINGSFNPTQDPGWKKLLIKVVDPLGNSRCVTRRFYACESSGNGNVDENDGITAYDASLVLQHVVSLIYLNDEEICRGDVNIDGALSSYDASLILQCVVGLCDDLPNGFKDYCHCSTYQPICAENAGIDSTVTIKASHVQGYCGQEIRIPILLAGQNEEAFSFQFDLTYDPNIMVFMDIQPLSSGQNYFMAKKDWEGILRIAGATGKDVLTLSSDGEALLEVIFRLKEGFPDNGEIPIDLSHAMINGRCVGTQKGRIKVSCCSPQSCVQLRAFPSEGTVSGGTVVDLYGVLGAFSPNSQIALDLRNDCSLQSYLPVESFQYIHGSHVRVTMPGAPEVGVAWMVDTNGDGNWDICQENGYTYKALGFTSDQGSQTVSVVDTAEDKLIDTISFPGTPGKLSLNKGEEEGRYIYILDAATGNLITIDGANFTLLHETILQDASHPYSSPGALDITATSPMFKEEALQAVGGYLFVSHVTHGQATLDGDGSWDLSSVPGGGVSVLTQSSHPQLIDGDNDPTTTSPGAPNGITRISIPLYTAPPGTQHFHPLSIQGVQLPAHTYLPGEKIPGSYVFVSGVGDATLRRICLCSSLGPDCQPPWEIPFGDPCPFPCTNHCLYIITMPRPVFVAIIDNNPYILAEDGSYLPNPDYWKNTGQAYKVMGGGRDGLTLGETLQPLAFFAGRQRDGLPPTVYMANEHENQLYLFRYDQTTSDWYVVTDDAGNPVTIPTGAHPTDVKVQEVVDQAYLYVTLAGSLGNLSDTVDKLMVIDTATHAELPLPYSPISLDACFDALHYPQALDTRNIGDKGYAVGWLSDAITVVDLPNFLTNPGNCRIDVGQGPQDMVIQPIPNDIKIFYQVYDTLGVAPPESFTQPAKKDNLMRDWVDVQELQETSANPQAVVGNIDAFQTKINLWVVDLELKRSLKNGVNLYRNIYLKDHALPGNP